MEPVSFTAPSWRIAAGPNGTSEVVATTLLGPADARALVDALGWQRAQDHLAPAIETAEELLALRALVSLVDELEALAASEHGGPVALRSAQVALLAEGATRYVAARDVEGHQPLRERERIERLRALSEPLFDLVSHFRAAEAEARASGLSGS